MSTAVTATPVVEAAVETHQDRVQKRMIQEIETRGPVHFLEWIGSWFSEAAAAQVEDEIVRALDGRPRNKDIIKASLNDLLLSEGSRASSYSSSAGHSLFRQATVAALAKQLDRLTASDRSKNWDEIRARQTPETAP